MTDSWTATFSRLEDSTAADFDRLQKFDHQQAVGLPERVLEHLTLLDGDAGGWPVNRFVHSLQSATLALRDGRDDEYIVCALLHDIGDSLASYNHADLAATILEPFVSEANLWMVKHHAILQGYHFFHHIGLDRNMRDRLKGHQHYDHAAEFVDLYDNRAFDSSGKVEPLSHFAPMVRRLLERPKRSIYLESIPAA
jgi:predicted HD phosphohydrolase